MNADDESKQVVVYKGDGTGTKIVDENSTSFDTNQVTTGGTYTVTFDYGSSGDDDAGLVKAIHIK